MVLGGTGKQRHGQMLNTWCLRGLEYPLSHDWVCKAENLYTTHTSCGFSMQGRSAQPHTSESAWAEVKWWPSFSSTRPRKEWVTPLELSHAQPRSLQPTVSCMARLQTWGELHVTAKRKAASDGLLSDTRTKLFHVHTLLFLGLFQKHTCSKTI